MRQEEKQIQPSKLLLPIMFCSTIVFTGFINIDNFKNSYKSSIEENPSDKKVALSKVENKYAENFKVKNNYININGAFANIIDEKELNNVIKLDNGYLTWLNQGKVDTSQLAENTTRFRDYLEEKNIPFLYVQAPYKIPTDDSFLPKGFKLYPNQNADNLLEGLKKNNINTLDLREEIKKDGIDHYSLFYKTDHHWTSYAGFWSHIKIVNSINNILKINSINNEYIDINNYNVETYKNLVLGSQGKRVGINFAGTDDLHLITPKFSTSFTLEVPNSNIIRNGSFNETMLFYEQLEKSNYFNKNPYAVYLNADYPYMKIKNNNIVNKKKIVIIKDSFSLVTVPFLSLHYNEVHWFDLRHIKNIDMIEKINEINPDIVICMYNPSSINNNMFNFINDDIIKELEKEYINNN